jgi:hypothetical protein
LAGFARGKLPHSNLTGTIIRERAFYLFYRGRQIGKTANWMYAAAARGTMNLSAEVFGIPYGG